MRAMTILSLLFSAVAAPASAASCAPNDVVVSRLADQYGESRQSGGLAENGALMEVFANPETGTWTVTITTADGTTCVIATGHAYTPITEGPAAHDPEA